MPTQFRRMRADEREPILDLLEHAFGERDLFARYMDFLPDFSPDDFLLACDAEEPVSCVQIFSVPIRLAGRRVLLGGIGSVATYESRRGRGLASALMRQAHDEMRARGMPLALLFAGPHPFYEALGWHKIPRHLHALRRADSGALEPDHVTRAFAPADLPAVRRLYDGYNAHVSCTTVRDETYWSGQLRYAGTPEEEFRVATRGGEIVAYARGIQMARLSILMEYARRPDAARALARLIIDLAPPEGRLLVPRVEDPDLEAVLCAAGADPRPLEDPQPMWKVLDAAELARIADLPPETGERALLERLVAGPSATYWPSDRF